MSDWKIRRDDVIRLIASYRKHKCLWDYRSLEYRRWHLKTKAWEQMARQFGKGVHHVKRKIKCLRSAYLSEKKKVDLSYGTTNIHQPTLFYYEDMTFLDSIVVVCRQGTRSPKYEQHSTDSLEHFEEKPTEENSFYDQYVTKEDTPSPPISPNRPAKSHFEKTQHRADSHSKLENRVNTLPVVRKPYPENSIYTSFGKTIALQLSQLPPLEATSTMSEIYQIISKNIIQTLSKNNKGHFYNQPEEFDEE